MLEEKHTHRAAEIRAAADALQSTRNGGVTNGGSKKSRKRTEKGPKKDLFGTSPESRSFRKKGASADSLGTRISSQVQLGDVIFVADDLRTLPKRSKKGPF